MKFTGTYETLKDTLASLIKLGSWIDLNDNQKQFRHNNGGIMNWYPSTGTINFQGKEASSLKEEIEKLLNAISGIDGSTPIPACQESQIPIENLAKPSIEQLSEPMLSLEEKELLDNKYANSELIIGLVAAVGTDLEHVKRVISERLPAFGYECNEIRVSRDIIKEYGNVSETGNQFERITAYIEEGNNLRKKAGDNSILALGVAAKINKLRNKSNEKPLPFNKRAFIINSIKHPEEVHRLRQIYSNGFFLIGVYADEKRRFNFLTDNLSIENSHASNLISRDADESKKNGQHTRDAFHLSDFFVHYDGNADKFQNDIWRILDLIFGKPFVTPTFDEFAMFMAFSASLRSADLSRQVGAVIAKDNNIVSTGANDVPKSGGGLYWSEYNQEGTKITDVEDGRDYKRGEDSNAVEKQKIIDNILKCIPDEIPDELTSQFKENLKNSRIKDITEYGRVVHAEMESILACARNNISTVKTHLYCTTFPCHNCAKHIISAGISRVIYVEPYPKSKALEFHSDSISIDKLQKLNVIFEPFVGVGPRAFFNLFSMNLGSGYTLNRKTNEGIAVEWQQSDGRLRMQMLPSSYLEREKLAANLLLEQLHLT